MIKKILKVFCLVEIVIICFLSGILFSKQSFENPNALTSTVNEYLPERCKISKNAEITIEKSDPVVQSVDEHFQSQLRAVKKYLGYEFQIHNSTRTDEDLVFEAKCMLPYSVVKSACEVGLTCEMVDEINRDEDIVTTGQFISDGKDVKILIRKRSSDVLSNMETTVLHEYGHFVAWYYKYKAGVDIFENFRPICEEEFSKYLLMNKGYWTYDAEMIGEYWAEAFSYIMFSANNEDKEPILSYWKENTPNTYAYVYEVINMLDMLESEE